MTLTKKQIITLVLLGVLIFALPLAVFLTRKRQDIRPRALNSYANLKLTPGSFNISSGSTVSVLVSLQLTNDTVKVSGADFMVLYDKAKFKVTTLTPSVGSGTGFDEAPVAIYDQAYSGEGGGYNFLRVSLVAKRDNTQLAGGTVNLANVTFQALSDGTGTIKFPDDNNMLQVVGWAPGVTP